MKHFKIYSLAIIALLLGSCASQPVSSKLLELAKPAPSIPPTTLGVEKEVEKVAATATRARNEVVTAKKNIAELEARVDEGKAINADFAVAIKELSEEHREKMLLFNSRFTALAARSKDSVSALKVNLENALNELGTLKEQLGQTERELAKNQSEALAVQKELKFYRDSWTELGGIVADNEKAKSKAEEARDKWEKKANSRGKWIWLFWSALAMLAVAVLLQLKFKLI